MNSYLKTEFPKNPTFEDKSVCPHCNTDLFYLMDGNRIFCSGCKTELRNNDNYKGGELAEN